MKNQPWILLAVLLGGAGLFGLNASGATGDGPGHEQAARVLHLPEAPYQYADIRLPLFYNSNPVRRLDNTPRSERVTDAGAALGRVLFYDTRLSANDTVSCGSCHQQAHAFSDPRRFSIGFAGQQTDRHAMALIDLRYYARGRFFWDERAASLDAQVLMPIQNSREMGQTLPKVIAAISSDPGYATLFERAFGDRTIAAPRIASALAQFVRSLVSYQSRYDQGLASTGAIDAEFPNFTASENRGKAIFLNRCAVCHLPPGQGVIFSDQAPQNDGVDGSDKVSDLGLADVTFNRFQAGLFKSPSLRNIEYTGPYMHDGRFATLDEVVEHYSSGVKAHPNLDPRLGGPRGRLRLTPFDKTSLVAFLKTLSDPHFMHDPKFSDPFVSKPSLGTGQPPARPVVMNKPEGNLR